MIEVNKHSRYIILLVLWISIFAVNPYSDFKVIDDISIDKIVFIVGLTIALGLLNYKVLDIIKKPPFRYFGIFVGWSFIVNTYHGFVNNDLYNYLECSLIFSILFLFSVFSYHLLKNNFSRAIKILLIFSILSLISNAIYMSFSTTYVSHGGFFANQNQLGRFGLTVSIIAILLYHNKKWPFHWYLLSFTIGLGAFVAIAPVRRAAILGFVILFALLLFKYWKQLGLSLVLCSFFLLSFYQVKEGGVSAHIDKVETRFVKEDSAEDSVLGRGYQRIFTHSHFLFFGAGEGGTERFERIWGQPLEIHSIFGNILFCYGVIGLIFVLLYYKGLILRIDYSALMLLPLLAHSIVHNDIRNIYFVIIPIIIYILQKESKVQAIEVDASSPVEIIKQNS